MCSMCLASMWFLRLVLCPLGYSLLHMTQLNLLSATFSIILSNSCSYSLNPGTVTSDYQLFCLYLWEYWTCFLKLWRECFLTSQYWQAYSTPSRWVLSRCSTTWLFVSILLQRRHCHGLHRRVLEMSFRAESNQGSMSTLKLRPRPVFWLGSLPSDEQAQTQVEMSRVQSEGGHPG